MRKRVFSTIVLLCLISLLGCAINTDDKPSDLPVDLPVALPVCVHYDEFLYSYQGDVIYYLPDNAEIIGTTNNVGLDMKDDFDSTVEGYVYTNPDDSSSLIFRWKVWDETTDGTEPYLILMRNQVADDIGSNLFALASPKTSAIHMSFYDGTEGISGFLFNPEDDRVSVVESLNRVDAVMVEDWTPEFITYPAYGFEVGSTDGEGYSAFWSNGYLVMKDGRVYRYDYDFGEVWKKYSWSEKNPIEALADMPCGRYLTQDENGWIVSNMHPADAPTAPDQISMRCIEWTNEHIVYELENNGSEDWPYGTVYELNVLLDGEWYKVPVNCDHYYIFNDLLFYLEPGEVKQDTVILTKNNPYSDLPPGHYRLVLYGVILEGDVS